MKDNNVLSNKNKKKIYYSFVIELVANIIMLIELIVIFIFSFMNSFIINNKLFVNYKEHSDIDYKIYLKDTTFYEKEYLEKDMAYVASLIDRIYIDYSYIFNVDEKSSIDFKHFVKAKIILSSQQNSKVFFEKEYDLTKVIKSEMFNENEHIILERGVNIDYEYYNNLANSFKSKYAVNADSRLDVTLYIEENNKENNPYSFNNSNKVTLTIPLSQQEINISFDGQNIDTKQHLIEEVKFAIKDKKHAILCIGSFILMILMFILLIKKIKAIIKNNVSDYDRYVNKILRGYDRIIVNIKTIPNLENYNVIEVDNFQELVDVRDNISQPINYYVAIKHKLGMFFVINKNNLYLLVIRTLDRNNNDEK